MSGLELIRRYETPVCIYSLYGNGSIEEWICEFKNIYHPVNKKAELFRMSGAEQE